jgi:hypothetical protein
MEAASPRSKPDSDRPSRPRWRRLLRRIAIGGLVVFALIQLVPYGARSHTNPATKAEPRWADARTESLVRRACWDCHSNETEWPWYSFVAPVSWRVQKDVDDGRRHLNFTEWQNPMRAAWEAAEEVEHGSMPLPAYLWMHAPARLSADEKAAVVRGLEATFTKDALRELQRRHKDDRGK